jgi:hypothetical protein
MKRSTEVPGGHMILTWDRTKTAEVGSWRLTASTVARLLNRVTRHNSEWRPEKAALTGEEENDPQVKKVTEDR